jgi:elongation factor 1-beta
MPSFTDLKSTAGLKQLNDHLATKSYIDGYAPSSSDVSVFEGLASAPSSDLEHISRWYSHVQSFDKNERLKFPKGGAGVAVANGACDEDDDDDEEVDLFGDSDEEDSEEKERIKQERLKAYAEKKAKKPGPIAKSSIVLDIKPWDDETDMAELEKSVRTVEKDGLLWGASKLVPVAYGVKKLVICCTVEDDKVGTDFLEEEITAFEDYVQSVDVAAFNKI